MWANLNSSMSGKETPSLWLNEGVFHRIRYLVCYSGQQSVLKNSPFMITRSVRLTFPSLLQSARQGSGCPQSFLKNSPFMVTKSVRFTLQSSFVSASHWLSTSHSSPQRGSELYGGSGHGKGGRRWIDNLRLCQISYAPIHLRPPFGRLWCQF